MARKTLPILALAALTLTAATFTTPTAPAHTPLSTPVAQPSTLRPAPSRQLADEIIRRLRRLGFNMIHNRTARPVEIVGDYA